MPTNSRQGKRSLGRTGARWERTRQRVLAANSVCMFEGNDRWPPCFELIDLDLKYPHPYSATVDHIEPLSKLKSWDDPRAYDPAACQPMHLVCNQRKGDGRTKKPKHRTSQDWRK